MAEKLFLLGRPGSGKSTVRRYITKIAQHELWSPYTISDYEILHDMCAADREHNDIRPTEFEGFEVINFSILDTALQIIERRVERVLERHKLDWPRITIIEFARSNYVQALSNFNPAFLKDAHFLILESGVNTCMERIYKRTRCHEFADDMYVPGNIMEGYYQVDATQETALQIQEALGLSSHRIQLMRTDGPREEFLYDCIRPYAHTLIEPASRPRRITGPLVISHTARKRIYNNPCPSPLQDMHVDEVKEQIDDTLERQLVGNTSI